IVPPHSARLERAALPVDDPQKKAAAQRVTFGRLVLLAPVAYALHIVEEAPGFVVDPPVSDILTGHGNGDAALSSSDVCSLLPRAHRGAAHRSPSPPRLATRDRRRQRSVENHSAMGVATRSEEGTA